MITPSGISFHIIRKVASVTALVCLAGVESCIQREIVAALGVDSEFLLVEKSQTFILIVKNKRVDCDFYF